MVLGAGSRVRGVHSEQGDSSQQRLIIWASLDATDDEIQTAHTKVTLRARRSFPRC